MTTTQLYGIYKRAYADAAALFAGGWTPADIESGFRSRLSPVGRVVAVFALLDATNGTPLRSEERFERAVAGSPALFRLAEEEAHPRPLQPVWAR